MRLTSKKIQDETWERLLIPNPGLVVWREKDVGDGVLGDQRLCGHSTAPQLPGPRKTIVSIEMIRLNAFVTIQASSRCAPPLKRLESRSYISHQYGIGSKIKQNTIQEVRWKKENTRKQTKWRYGWPRNLLNSKTGPVR